MCGIAGIMALGGDGGGRPVLLEELQSMCAAMVHRGPDSGGFYLGTGAGLGMRRLSIIDLETGQQPVRNEDGSVWAVFNGEIYNYRQLRRELEGRGHRFYSAADTETIVHLYEEYGVRCVEKLRGMFAFAVWDEARRQLLLARDRLGIKPLYYAEAGGRLLFASELKAILQIGEVERTINWSAFGHLLTFLSTPRADSILSGVRKLEPGRVLTVSREHGARIQSYWNLTFVPDRARDERCFVERLRELIDESVRLHLASDVPLGAFLSGGMDSSAVVAAMSRNSSGPVRTFSIGFGEEDYNELKYARLVAKAFGTDHHELVLEPDVMEVIEEIAWHLDEPFGDPSAIPTFMVSKLAAQHVTVVLSGDGGDELFGGYDRYVIEQRERREWPPGRRRLLGLLARFIPYGVKGCNFARHFSLAGAERYLDAQTLFRRDEQASLLHPDCRELLGRDHPWRDSRQYLERAGHWLSALQYLDLMTYLPLDILTKVDRMSMAHSIEARVPLLDHALVEFAATIPPELLLRNGDTKHVFKRAMEGRLPEAVIHRKKQGFAVPLGHWFRGQLAGFVRDLLLSQRSRQRGIVNPAYVEKLLSHQARGRELDMHLWTLISFELWCRTFLDRRPTGAARHGARDGRPCVASPGAPRRGRLAAA